MSGVIMTFPKTWEEYEKYWGFNDSEEVYTNNARLISSFRVKQWLDHIKEAEPKWIPVTERLPENSEEVLITRRTIRFTKDDSGRRIDLGYYYSNLKRWDTLDLDDIEVLAWMPLPEPYQLEVDKECTIFYADGTAWMPLPEPYKDGDDE